MRRRDFVKAIARAAAAWPIAAGAQQSERVRRIGIVMGFTESDPAAQAQVNALRQQLWKLGWIEGVNIHIDYRYPADDPSRIRAVAVELLGLAPDLIVSSTNLVTAILKSEVRAVPLVFLQVSDPIGSGFVTNLVRPTGNVTGFDNFEPSMGGKWLERLKEIAPNIERVGFILNPETPPNVGFL
jgi:putative ABC transport system substrate-binding protein